MKYETAKQASERLGVTVRTIQKWACSGKIPGAYKLGKAWLIPDDTLVIKNIDDKTLDIIDKSNNPMPILNACFKPGECLQYIQNNADGKEKDILLGEYYYATGRYEESSEILCNYIYDKSAQYRLPTILNYIFLYKNYEQYREDVFGIDRIKSEIEEFSLMLNNENNKAVLCFVQNVLEILFPKCVKNVPPIEEYLRYLPEGLKLFAYYILSQKAYQQCDYAKGIVIAEMGVISVLNIYPIPMIYLHLIAAVNLVNLFKIKEAKQHLVEAWNIAREDDFIQPFGEHYGILMGLIESVFKKKDPETYKKIVDVYNGFSKLAHLTEDLPSVFITMEELTNTEYIIAMMFSRNWKIKEISDQIEMSERSVKSYLQSVYQKLGVNSRKGLRKYFE